MADILKDAEVLELPLTRDSAPLSVLRDDKAQTVRFLEAHPFLYELLTQVVEHVQTYFHEASLVLEIVTDMEDASQQLLLTIDTPLQAEDAIQRFEQFREDWWLENLDGADAKLSIALSYPVEDV